MKKESKFWQEVKKKIKDISFIRLESWASAGVPDLLCYNKNNKFFTCELKVTSNNSVRFSPHQISFHVQHPRNSFILIFLERQRAVKLYEGSSVLDLHTKGHGPCSPLAESWNKVQETFVNVT